MNAFIRNAEQARASLKVQTGMDELDYQLMILESGCRFLEESVRPLDDQSEALAAEQRYHLMGLGFFDFYQQRIMVMEIDLVRRWSNDELMPMQTKQYRRKALLDQALTLHVLDVTWQAYDTWLKNLERKNTNIYIPELSTSH